MHRLPPLIRESLIVVLLATIVLVWYLEDSGWRWFDRLRSRLYLGIPWGTIFTVGVLLFVYLVVQRGFLFWYRPLALPFTSWSYRYPIGWFIAAFAHSDPSHLIGNLIGVLTIGPLAEYTIGHYPLRVTSRAGDGVESGRNRWLTDPRFRVFVVIPAGILGLSLVMTLFSWGPTIGFSNVIFVMVGVALVRYPLGVIVALTARDALRLLIRALRDPSVVTGPAPRFVDPWWANVAIQGHLLGFLVGVLIGIQVYSRRNDSDRPSAIKLWIGSVLAAVSLSLWAVWWFHGIGRFVLFRALGVILILLLATLVTVAVRATEQPTIGGLTRKQVAVLLLLLPVVSMAILAIPVNMSGQSGEVPNPDGAVTIRGFSITYAEDVPNPRTDSWLSDSDSNELSNQVSGVIVTHSEFPLWTRAVSQQSLAFSGGTVVRVGGITWVRTVFVKREGWRVTGGNVAYRIWLNPRHGRVYRSFHSGPARSSVVLDGRNFSIVPNPGGFQINVSENGSIIATAPVPRYGESVTVAGIRFRNQDGRLVAIANRTRVTIARSEQYQ